MSFHLSAEKAFFKSTEESRLLSLLRDSHSLSLTKEFNIGTRVSSHHLFGGSI